MCDLIFECGIFTTSWYAELAFRRRVSMSAIGSVIPMACSGPSHRGFPASDAGTCDVRLLPAGLGDTGQFAAVRHCAEADAAQAEPAVDGARAPATGAPRVAADLELRCALLLDDQRCLRHCQASLNGKPSRRSSERPSASVGAVVTTVMSIPRWRSTLSGSISWNMTC